MKRHENQLSELEEQQKNILATVRKDTDNLEKQRQLVLRELEKASILVGVFSINCALFHNFYWF